MRRVWGALVAIKLLLAGSFMAFGAYFVGVRGLEGKAVEDAMQPLFAWPAIIGFGSSALVTGVLAKQDGLSWRELGWSRPAAMDIGISLGAAALLCWLNAAFLYPLVQYYQAAFDPELSMLSLPSACLMMTVATASEDSLYRGYALKMLQARYGTTAAVAITTAFYAMLAGIQGWPLMLWALYFGLILSLIRLWRNNLWPVFLTHLLTSIAPRLLDLF